MHSSSCHGQVMDMPYHMVAVAVSSRFRTKGTAGADQKHHGSKPSLSNMAVSSVEYNNKMDGKSSASNVKPLKVSMGNDGESGGVTSSGTGSGSVKMGHTSQSSGDCSQPQDGRHGATTKRKPSDSLYLDVSTPVAPTASQVIHANSQKPKKGSFQITRVINRKQLEMDTVDHDHAEDADSIGDDFDETNTEDLSSEIMDTSKMTDIDQDPSSEDTVQSLAVEDLQREGKQIHASLPQTKEETPQDSKTTAADMSRTISDEKTDPNFGENRFRIVKVSNERFLRGRWTCVDYKDSERTQREKSNEDLGSGNSSAASSVHYVPGVDDPSKNPLLALVPGEATPSIPETQSINQTVQTLIPNGDYTAQPLAGNAAVSVEQSGAHEMSGSVVQPSQQASQSLPSQHSQQPAVTYAAPTSTTAGAPITVSNSTSHLPAQDYPASSHPDFLGQAQQANQGTTQTIPQQQQQQQQPPAPNQTSQAPVSEFNNGVAGKTNPADSSLGEISTKSVQVVTSTTNVTDFNPNSGAVSGSAGPSNNASPSDGNIQSTDFHSTAPTDGIYIVADDQQSTLSVEETERIRPQPHLHLHDEASMMKPLMMQVGAGLAQPLLEMVQTMHYPPKDTEDESGASTVAIDNKIEQAMDLVKSHLMFAVREEVMVLKEQIKELLEKNSQLEYENSILRTSATQETLSKLSPVNPAVTQASSS